MSQFGAQRVRHITEKGRPVTLRRGNQTASVLAFFNVWGPDDLAPPLRQGDVRIDLLADISPLSVPLRDPDLILTQEGTAYAVVFANPVFEADILIGWTVAGRGA